MYICPYQSPNSSNPPLPSAAAVLYICVFIPALHIGSSIPFFQIPYICVAAAAAKLLQSCPTLCDPIDGSPPGSSVPGILQARIPEWVAISFSNAWKWKVKMKSLSRVYALVYNIWVSLSDLFGMTDSKFIHITTNDPILFLFYDWAIFQHCFILCSHLELIQPANSSPPCRAQPKCHFLHEASPESQRGIAACHCSCHAPCSPSQYSLCSWWHHQHSAFSLGDLR